MPPVVLGLNAAHDASACLLLNGRIACAIAEERLTRVKHHEGFPQRAIEYCLRAAGLAGVGDVDCIVINEYPQTDFTAGLRHAGYAGALITNPSHHLLHALYAWVASGRPEAAVMVIDGSGYSYGEYLRRASPLIGAPPQYAEMEEAESLYVARDGRLEIVGKRWGLWDASRPYYRFPSLGHLFSMASQYIFGHMNHAGKTMGLAPYGDPTKFPQPFITLTPDGIEIRTDWILDLPPRSSAAAHLDPICRNLAAKVQDELEGAVGHLATILHKRTSMDFLCMSGGVALNSVTNGLLLRNGPFRSMFVTPAAGDSGVAIGAALFGHQYLTDNLPSWRGYHDFHGSSYRRDDLLDALDRQHGLVRWEALSYAAMSAANDIANGKIVGWFEGGSELGPRALGHRSIIGDPRGAWVRDHLNDHVKFREPFRPYAASVLEEHASEFFDLTWNDSFMLTVTSVHQGKRDEIASVCHIDGTCRVQTLSASDSGEYRRLVAEFHALTGVPLVLNTSFNVRGEPIVETPEDALRCFLGCNLDVLYLDGYRVTKARLTDVTDPDSLVPVTSGRLTLRSTQLAADGGWGSISHEIETRTGYRMPIEASEAWALRAVDGRRTVRELTSPSPGDSSTEAIPFVMLASLQEKGLLSFRWPAAGDCDMK